MRDSKKLLLYYSIILWVCIGLIGLLQIPFQTFIGWETKGYALDNEILVHQVSSDDTTMFVEKYQSSEIEFHKYADTDYAGMLTDDSYLFLIEEPLLDDFMTGYDQELSLIEISKPQLDFFTVYIFDKEENIISEKDYGRSLPFDERDYNHRNFFIKLNEPENIGSILFHVRTNSYLQFPISLWHELDWIDHLSGDLIGHGLFYGALFIMLLYNIILGISIRDKNYMFFSIFILSYTLLQGTWDGFAYQFIWPYNGSWDLQSNPVFINLVSMSFLAFTMNFMKVVRRAKGLKYSYVTSLLLHSAAILGVIILPSSMSVYFAMFNTVCTLVLSLIAIIRKKFSSKAEVIYLLAWQFFIATNLLNVLAGFKLIPYTRVTEISPKIAIIGLISLFSLALSEKLNIVEYLRGIESEKRILLKNLHDMHIKISSSSEIHAVFDYLLDRFYSITRYENGVIVLFDLANCTLDVYDKKTKSIDTLQIEENLFTDIYEALKKSEKQWKSYVEQLGFPNDEEWKCCEVIPLVNIDHPIGFIVLGSKSQIIIDPSTIETINDFATQIAITIDNKLLLDNVTYQARHDFLTKAYNRRYFFEKASEVFDSVSANEVLGTIMIDVDDFKRVNDIHGHLIGDEVLIETALRIKNSIGVTEILGRYGGEEFIVLIKAVSKEDVYQLATNILKAFQDKSIIARHLDKSVEIDITVSIGIAFSNKDVTTLFTLTNAADIALYEAKRKGKNQIAIAD